jgi:hypothetical protein
MIADRHMFIDVQAAVLRRQRRNAPVSGGRRHVADGGRAALATGPGQLRCLVSGSAVSRPPRARRCAPGWAARAVAISRSPGATRTRRTVRVARRHAAGPGPR